MQAMQQLQDRVNHLRQDISQIQQMCSQMQQMEQQNAQQLQQLSNHESTTTQQLQRLSQTLQHMNQDLAQISSASQQIPQQNQTNISAQGQPYGSGFISASVNPQALNSVSNLGQYTSFQNNQGQPFTQYTPTSSQQFGPQATQSQQSRPFAQYNQFAQQPGQQFSGFGQSSNSFISSAVNPQALNNVSNLGQYTSLGQGQQFSQNNQQSQPFAPYNHLGQQQQGQSFQNLGTYGQSTSQANYLSGQMGAFSNPQFGQLYNQYNQ